MDDLSRNEKIAVLFSDGKSARELAKMFGLTESRIRQIVLDENGSTPKLPNWKQTVIILGQYYHDKKTITFIAKHHDLEEKIVQKVVEYASTLQILKR